MILRHCLLKCLAAAIVLGTIPATNRPSVHAAEKPPARSTLPAPQENTSELQATLFVQDPHLENGRKAVQVIWIPEEIQKYCLGKTAKECSTIDYCIRTTNKQAPMCQHLSVDTTRLPPYPPGVPPRRVFSIVYFFPVSTANGFARLTELFENAPKASLDRLSRTARIRARIKLTRSPEDDQFDVLEILSAPPS